MAKRTLWGILALGLVSCGESSFSGRNSPLKSSTTSPGNEAPPTLSPNPTASPIPSTVDLCTGLTPRVQIPFRAPSWSYAVLPYNYPDPPAPFAALPARIQVGNAPFGEGYDEATTWASYKAGNPSHTQIVIEKKFTLTHPRGVRVSLMFDNGAVVYLNGVEVFRQWPSEGRQVSAVDRKDVCTSAIVRAGENTLTVNVEDHGLISYVDAQLETYE